MADDDKDTVPPIEHARFRQGLHRGEFRVVINPALARPYLAHRLRLTAWLVASIGLGAAAALAGQSWAGLILAGLGVAAGRLIKHQAPKLVLHLAEQNVRVYAEVTHNGVMEVRAAG